MLYCIGCEFAPVVDWENYVEISAPRNYKDPAKIEAYIADRKIELANGKAAIVPMTGTILKAVIIKQQNKTEPVEIKEVDGPGAGARALSFIQTNSGLITDPGVLGKLIIAGCEMREIAALMAIEYIAIDKALPFSLQWLVGLDSKFKYNEIPGFIDPARLLFGDAVDMRLAGARFGLPSPSDAKGKAILALQLSQRLGL